MDTSHLTTPLAVFTAGLVTSVHCSAMCGPLTCALIPGRSSPLALLSYHGTRAAAYVIVGGIFGATGESAASVFSGSPARFLPWVLIALFLALAFGLEQRLPTPHFLSRLLLKLKLGGNSTRASALLGMATPFLPCAPLYLVFGVALFAGSAFAGAKLMACFAAGTIPLYWLLQSQYVRLQARLSPLTVQRSRRALAFVSAILLAWRAAGGAGGVLAQVHCPFCQ